MSSPALIYARLSLTQLWDKLMDEKVRVIAILGIGGLGKTTLARQVFNKLATTPHHFDLVIWVTVSHHLSVEKLQDDIWRSIGVYDSDWVNKTFHEKSQTLAHTLCEKKFVLFLDDVFISFPLSDIGVPSVEPGTRIHDFKVMLTSRSVYACRSMGADLVIYPRALDQSSAWDLFSAKLGDHKLGDPKIMDMANRIVQHCSGLPLLLCVVARAMACRTTYDEWEDALKRILSVPVTRSGPWIHDFLEFCFDSLPGNITRSCFLYFSLFPEDYSMPKTELIDFWICEQLLGHQQDVLSSGYDTLDALIGASLLVEEETDCVKLQDVVGAAALSRAFRSQIFKNACLIEVMDRKSLETVGWIVPMRKSVEKIASIPPKLSTFLLNHNPFIAIKGEITQFMDALTVLVLSNSGVEVVPKEIANLVSLQYLNLSHTWIDSLPVELKMLAKLKCLNLEHDCQLRVVPKQLVYCLSSLQVLKMFRCGFSVEELGDNIISVRNMDIDPLLSLKHLQVLSITITCNSALEKFFSSPKLTSCTQSLSLEVFWGTESLDISPLAAMKNLLTLETHQAETLRKLSFDLVNPELLKQRSFERLGEVTIESCSSLQELTWVMLAQNLVTLKVKGCEQMKEIISRAELGDTSPEPFAKLEILELEDLPKLKSIYSKVLPLQCLKRIKIVDCSLLKELPLNPDSAKTDEMVIEAEEDWWGNVEWVDDTSRTTFLSVFRPLKLVY